MTSTGVVFDLDDTLYLEREYVRSGFRAVDELAAQTYGVHGLLDQLERVFASGVRHDVIGTAWRALGHPASSGVTASLVDCYRQHVPEIRLLPGAVEALDWAAGHGHAALVSDGDALRQERKIDVLGLRRWLHPVVVTGRYGRGWSRPSARPLEHIAFAWAQEVDTYVFIGDDPARDFAAPQSLGWTTVRVRHPLGMHSEADSGPDVDHELADLGDLPFLLTLPTTTRVL